MDLAFELRIELNHSSCRMTDGRYQYKVFIIHFLDMRNEVLNGIVLTSVECSEHTI